MSIMNKTICLKNLFHKVLEGKQQECEQRGIALQLDFEKDVPDTVTTDLVKLTQVLNALIQQAVLRTENGSVVLRAQNGNDSVVISVEDTGWTPDAEKIRTILDPTTSPAQWKQEENLAEIAMPLRLSAKFISILGNKLEVETAEGKTCFFFSLSTMPADIDSEESALQEKAEPVTTEDSESSESATQDAVTILLVDDVEENRSLLEVLLKKLGYHCHHSANGKEAVDQCSRQKYDLVLMDLQMPLLDGFEATRQIRAGQINQKTPIVAMTASGQKGDDLKALDAGCNDCLGKPISRKMLQRKIWRLLEQTNQIHRAEEGLEIVSFLEGDPDYQKAVETFVSNLPGRIEELKQAFENRDLKDLALKAHALKGLGGFAGFPVFTEKAKCLEETVKAEDFDWIRGQLDEMVNLCMRTKLQQR